MKHLLCALALLAALGGVVPAQPVVNFDPVVATGGFVTFIVSTPVPGDDRLFLVYKDGTVRIVDAGGSLLATPFLDIDSLVNSVASERGLLSLVFHPDFGTSSNFFFVNYTNAAGNTVIARYEVDGTNPNIADQTTGRILLTITQDFSNHNGGQIQFGPDGLLYIGMGDGGSGNDPNCRAQDVNARLGKMLRIDVDQNVNTMPYYGIPAGNPYATGGGAAEIFAIGVRNPYRFSFDRMTGDLWIADVGQIQREEINFVPAGMGAGFNFGWDRMEGTRCNTEFGSCPFGVAACNDPSFTPPVEEYGHTGGRCSITGGYVYRGPNAPDLIGLYFYADYCTAEVFVYDPNTDISQLVIDHPGNIATFGEGSNGDLYTIYGNLLYRITGPTSTEGWTVY